MSVLSEQASREFGRYIHNVAVKVGSKTTLGELAGGVPKADISLITAGEGNKLDRAVLEAVLSACESILGSVLSVHLKGLIENMVQVKQEQILTPELRMKQPLTHVERRNPSLVDRHMTP